MTYEIGFCIVMFILAFGIVTWQAGRVRKAEERAEFLQSAFNIAVNDIVVLRACLDEQDNQVTSGE